MSAYKIFCDESNHLLSDNSNLMVNGAIKIEESRVVEANKHIKFLRYKHNYQTELKWTKLVAKQKEFYKELIDYFFASEFMQFKATLVMNKSKVNHERYGRTHDEFYYVVYYYTLRDLLNKNDEFKIYFDYKDSLGSKRVGELAKVLENANYGTPLFNIIHSHESQLIQLCDLFIGAIGYVNREDIAHDSAIKSYIAEHIDSKIKTEGSNIGDIHGTKPWAKKCNIFRWVLSDV